MIILILKILIVLFALIGLGVVVFLIIAVAPVFRDPQRHKEYLRRQR